MGTGLNGYWIHDYLVYNPSNADAEQQKADRAAAGRKGGVQSGKIRRSRLSEANDEANEEASASSFEREATKQKGTPYPVTRTSLPVPVGARRAPAHETESGHVRTVAPMADAVARLEQQLKAWGVEKGLPLAPRRRSWLAAHCAAHGYARVLSAFETMHSQDPPPDDAGYFVNGLHFAPERRHETTH